MIDPDVLEALANAGATTEMIIAAVRADAENEEARRAAKRANNAERQQRYRDRRNADNALLASCDVTSGDTPPVLDKETPPKPPKEINPTPRVGSALARKAAGFGPPEDVTVERWNEFCSQRKKPLSSTAYSRIINTLTEAKQVGWPPGEVVARSIESGWETVFVPKESINGTVQQNRRQGNRSNDGFANALSELSGFGAAHQ